MSSTTRRRGLVTAAFAVVLAAFGLVLAASSGASTANLPADPQQHGFIGLCNEKNQNVTSGSIDTKPFIWKAVSSSVPPKAFTGRGQNTILEIFQPRPQTAPSEWSGGPLTAASFYRTSSHPTVQSTYADESLRDFMRQFPTQVNGLYALRFSYGRANYGLYRATYPVTTIQVTGNRWKVIHGGTVSCASGRAVSDEQLSGVASRAQYTAHQPATAARTSTAAPGSKITNTPVEVRGSTEGGTARQAGADAGSTPTADSRSAGSSSTWLLWLVLGVGALGIGGFVVLAQRRRMRTYDGTEP